MATIKPKAKKSSTEQVETSTVVSQPVETEPKKAAKKTPTTVLATESDTPVVVEEANAVIKKRKLPKAKVIRDSFSFPEQDYLKISELKKACLAQGIHVKKGEILRAGLQLLSNLDSTQLLLAIEQVDRVKTGRPKA